MISSGDRCVRRLVSVVAAPLAGRCLPVLIEADLLGIDGPIRPSPKRIPHGGPSLLRNIPVLNKPANPLVNLPRARNLADDPACLAHGLVVGEFIARRNVVWRLGANVLG